MNKLQILGPFAIIGAMVLISSEAEAFGGKHADDPTCGAKCCYTVPNKLDTGDLYYGPDRWDWCRDDYLANNARVFGLTSKYWGGHGWKDACNTDNPTGRFFSALVALTETSPTKSWPKLAYEGGNVLRWGAGFAARMHDDLRAQCAFSETANATAHRYREFTDLWIPNHFYKTSKGATRLVVARAGTIIHEAVHIHGLEHNAENGKDTIWEYEGAWTTHAEWLSLYASEGVNAPIQQRCAAQDQANNIVNTKFARDPGLTFDDLDKTLCR